MSVYLGYSQIVIIYIAFAALVVALVALARTCRIQSDLHATRQEVEIQRIVIDEPETPQKRRRHLRGLAAFV